MTTDWVPLGGAGLASLTALIIAIWGDWLKALAFRPKLSISIAMGPPDCHSILFQEAGPGIVHRLGYSYYCRLKVSNDGRVLARDVELKLLCLRRHDGNVMVRDDDFMPLNLCWSHAQPASLIQFGSPPKLVVAPTIPPKLFRHCDLLHTWPPTDPDRGMLPSARLVTIDFDTEVFPNEVRPNEWPERKEAGTYELDLVVVASNARPVYKTLQIAFRGFWEKDEAEMFAEGLVIRDVTRRPSWTKWFRPRGHREN